MGALEECETAFCMRTPIAETKQRRNLVLYSAGSLPQILNALLKCLDIAQEKNCCMLWKKLEALLLSS